MYEALRSAFSLFATAREGKLAGAAVFGEGRLDGIMVGWLTPGAQDLGHTLGECLWTARGTSNQPIGLLG